MRCFSNSHSPGTTPKSRNGLPGYSGTPIAIFGSARKHRVTLSSLKEVLTKSKNMLYTIFAILLILWLLGLVGGVGGSLIHLLLVVALVVFLIQFLSGRRVA